MEPVPSDVDCVARSLSEPEAFELIFARHFPAIHTYLHRRAGLDLADELAAETFALAFAQRASCRASGSVLPWLYGIATNLLHRHRRSERRQLRAYSRSGIDRWVGHELRLASAYKSNASRSRGRIAASAPASRASSAEPSTRATAFGYAVSAAGPGGSLGDQSLERDVVGSARVRTPITSRRGSERDLRTSSLTSGGRA